MSRRRERKGRGAGLAALVFVALVFVAVAEAGAAHRPAGPVDRPVVLPLAPYLGATRTVAVGAGADSLPFLFDTGGGLTVITPKMAKRLGCEPFGRVSGFRTSGERLDMPRCGPVRLDIGPLRVEDEAAVLDLMALIGGNAAEVGGLITLRTLRDHPFTLDFAHGRLILETDASLKRRVRGMKAMEVRTERQSGGAALDLFVAVQSRQGKIWLELDSGNVGPVQLAPHAVEQLGLTAEALAAGEVALDFVGLGPVPLTASRQPIIHDGLLNADTIAKMVLTLDLRSERMWGRLLPAPPAPESRAPRSDAAGEAGRE